MKAQRISDAELLDYIAGRLTPQRRAEVTGMLASGEVARERVETLRRTWELLGEWQAPATAPDVLAGVTERLGRDRGRVIRFPLNWRTVGRVAATWLIAIGLGVGGGRAALLLRPAPTPASEQQTPQDQEDRVVDALYLDLLGAGGSTGLAQSVLDDGDNAGEEADG